MNYAIRVTGADKVTVQETSETLLSVQFEITGGDEVIQKMRHGFPLDISEEDLTAELQQVLATFASDEENTARNAAFDAENEKADATIAAVIGKEITN